MSRMLKRLYEVALGQCLIYKGFHRMRSCRNNLWCTKQIVRGYAKTIDVVKEIDCMDLCWNNT
jgi:hypothetical protein